MAKMLFTSESVTEGHPDKVADQISDAVLDAILENDPSARVACESVARDMCYSFSLPYFTWFLLSVAKVGMLEIKSTGSPRWTPPKIIYILLIFSV